MYDGLCEPCWDNKVDEEYREEYYCETLADEYNSANDCPRCEGQGDVPTEYYESYFGAQMKPCPQCHGKLDGLGHGRLS